MILLKHEYYICSCESCRCGNCGKKINIGDRALMCLYREDGVGTPYDEACNKEHVVLCALGGGIIGAGT